MKKQTLELKNSLRLLKENVIFVEELKVKFFTKQMTRGKDFLKNAKCTHGHRSAMSNLAWCDLNKNCTVLKLHDFCHNPKCKFQKMITFTPNQFQLGSIKRKLQKIFRGTQTAWKKFFQTAVNVAAPFIGMAVIAKSKNPEVGQATTNKLKSISGGKILSLTDMHGRGLRLKVMYSNIISKKVTIINECLY